MIEIEEDPFMTLQTAQKKKMENQTLTTIGMEKDYDYQGVILSQYQLYQEQYFIGIN